MKLLPPALPPGYVPRPRLHETLTRGVEGPVTLVSAHAGTGKTVLVSAWSRGRDDVAWLTVDRDDNWSPRFWQGVERALGAENGTEDDPVSRLLGWAETRATPVVLVVDDLHEIENPIVLKELARLIADAPPQLHLVLLTRADPQLRLPRLRIAGALTEIRADTLAFTVDECRELLGPLADELDDDDIATLHEHTEGWAAGVRLATLSLGREEDAAQFIRNFAGDERAVADYLLNEILERQSERRREFLLRTSVADDLTAGLADDLTGGRDSASTLSELELENVVVASRAGLNDVYRYHALLRDFLRGQLRRTRSHELRTLERRTAHWYWRHDDPGAAFRHAVAAGDWDLVDELTIEAWPTVMFSASPDLLDAILQLPDDELAGRPGFALRVAAAAAITGSRPRARHCIAQARADSEALPPGPRRDGLATLAKVLDMSIARLDGDFAALVPIAQELLELQPGGTRGIEARRIGARALALSALGTATLALGNLREAEEYLDEGFAAGHESRIDQVSLNCLSQRALLALTRGRLRRAAELATEGSEFAERRGWSLWPQAIGCHLVLGWLNYLWDDLHAAEEHLALAEAAAQASQDRWGRVGAAVLSALVLAAEGNGGGELGLRRLRAVQKELAGRQPPAYLEPLLATARARLLASRGDLDDARVALDGTRSEQASVLRARLLLADGAPGKALAELDAVGAVNSTSDLPSKVEASVLEAVACKELRERDRSGRAFEHALTLAEPDNVRRPFVDGGPAVRTLLVDQIRHGTSHRALVAELIASLDRRAPNNQITKPELLDPLSEREQAVLRFLPTMMSNAEIASELYLSVNTVKTHLKSIYRKLGATRRREAVERARGLDLL
jgi:LuxR family maltose regulon positive regulatory protein